MTGGENLRTSPPTKLPTSNLPTHNDKHAAYLRRVDDRIRTRATRIVAESLLAADIDDDAAKPEGWSDREYRVARDARKPMKQEPGYLQRATRILESYKRAESEVPAVPLLNADVKIYVRQECTYNYRVVDVTDRENK